MGLLLSLAGIRLSVAKRVLGIPKQLRLLLLANLILTVIWWIPVVILNPERNLIISLVYTGILPFAIFGFVRIPERRLTIALAVLTLLLAGTVTWDFVELNTLLVPGGYDLTVARQMILRPETFVALGRTGYLLRPVGILGGDRPHDTGNLLAILSAYWTARLFQDNASKIAISMMATLGISALLMTQSASNIAAFFVGLLFIIYAHRGQLLKVMAPAALTAGALLFVFAHFLGVHAGMLWQWSQRVAPSGAWGDMTALGITDPVMDLLTVFTGHGSSLGISKVGDVTELGFVKMLMDSGLISFLVFVILLTYPVLKYISLKNPDKRHLIPYVAPVIVGFISLWHYGSVLRTTNIFVFFALYAHALINVNADARTHAR
jgi:hypothetical protein